MSAECECSGNKKRLLLVACNPNFRRTLERILGRCGYQVDGADSGEAALRLFESKSYDAVISEVVLAGTICGLTVFDRVRRLRPELPIIFLTECETTRLRAVIEQTVRVNCLSLPVDVDQLKQVIARTTANSQASAD